MTRYSFALVWLLSGCALFGKSEPLEPLYYTPEVAVAAELARRPRDPAQRLRLGRVAGGSHLRDRISYRNGSRELGYYEERRWTERPEVYVERALSRVLFEQRGVTRVVSGSSPTLDVELLEFDELVAPKHAVRVSLRILLSAQREATLERSFSVELPVPSGERYEVVAEAMAGALSRCIAEVADAVVSELAAISARTRTDPTTPSEPSRVE